MIGNEEYLCRQVTSWKTEAELRYAEVGRLKITNAELQAKVQELTDIIKQFEINWCHPNGEQEDV